MDKKLNSLIYRPLFYVNIYESYKLLKTVRFFGPPCIYRPSIFSVRTNRRAIAMMFVCPSLCSSVCLSGRSVHCDHTVQLSAVLSLRLDSQMLWAP